jgi:heat shock protein HslJ
VIGAACVLAMLVVILLAVTSCGGSDQSSELKNVAWRWSGVREGEGLAGLSPIPDPASYLLRLDDDGTFIGRADCKSVGGAYSLSGKELTLELRPTAQRRCGKGSRAARYIALLKRVATYEIYGKGALALGLENDTGSMYFYPGAG